MGGMTGSVAESWLVRTQGRCGFAFVHRKSAAIQRIEGSLQNKRERG